MCILLHIHFISVKTDNLKYNRYSIRPNTQHTPDGYTVRSMLPRKESEIKRGLIHLKRKDLKDPVRSKSWQNEGVMGQGGQKLQSQRVSAMKTS